MESFVARESPVDGSRLPVVLLLQASKSMQDIDEETLAETVFRLLQYLSDTEVPTTVIAFNSRATLLHPERDVRFELLECSLDKGRPKETLRASVSTVQSAVNKKIKFDNIEWIVRQFGKKVSAQTTH